MQTAARLQVISHPLRAGFWTICVNGERIYGEYDRRELAVAVMLTRWA